MGGRPVGSGLRSSPGLGLSGAATGCGDQWLNGRAAGWCDVAELPNSRLAGLDSGGMGRQLGGEPERPVLQPGLWRGLWPFL